MLNPLNIYASRQVDEDFGGFSHLGHHQKHPISLDTITEVSVSQQNHFVVL